MLIDSRRPRGVRRALAAGLAAALIGGAPAAVDAQSRVTLPLRQSTLDASAADPSFEVPLDSTTDGHWLGGGASAPRWDVTGDWLYFRFDPAPTLNADIIRDTPWYRVSRDGRTAEAVAATDALTVPAGVRYTRDGTRAVWFHRGELRYWRRGMREPRLLLARASGISPQWSADEREIRFVEQNALWAIDPANGAMRQLTQAYQPKDPDKPDAIKDELKRQQLEIFDFVKRRKEERDSTELRSRRDRAPMPIVVPLKADNVLSSLELAPNGRYVTFLSAPRPKPVQTIYADYVTESGIAEQRTSRPKVGDVATPRRAGIVTADPYAIPDSVKITWVDTVGLGKKATVSQLLWNRAGTQLVVEFQSYDYKDRWLFTVDPVTGKRLTQLDHQHDEAWHGGPGHTGGWMNPGWLAFSADDDELLFTSEATGWAHLYAVRMDGTRRALTSGEWEIRDIDPSRDGSKFWISAGIEHPNELHLYEVTMAGGQPRRIDHAGEGETRPTLSPDERTLAYLWSSPSTPWDLYIQPTSGTPKPVQVTRAGTDGYWRIAWAESDFIRFDDDKGKPVYARVYRPRTQHSNRPAVLEIHGAGYAQGVHKTMAGSGAHGGALYAQHLTSRGVTYVVLDYRGSSGYGRDMRTDIYRNMGDRDVASAVSLIPVLQRDYGVNPKAVGLFGCSYGGFYTLMALFRHPGTFAAGAAQCSVTDWAHYNHGYTARILNGTPAEDTASYRTSSPIYHAAGLQDRLLLQHGLVDGNVQYQDAARLAQRLMELGKDFDFVTYPIEAHGWRTRWSKIDSQRRVTRLWEETILRGEIAGRQ